MRKKIFILLVVVVIVLITIFFFKVNDGATNLSSDDPAVALSAKDMENIIQMVGRHIRIPEEKPNIGVVTDIASLLQNEPFYQGAKNGDVLLIYPSISRAILFDPQQDVIINVGPVVFENPEEGPASSTVGE
ncbi:MAG: hypothetical protein NUW02_02485 [Candidatus Campbellbacteria bacterium]|nr:hypothetical protein [Candidatus Campbellbacteria bacterium]